MKCFSAGVLAGLALVWLSTAPPAYGQTPESDPRDFVMVELLLGIQGAVIGGGMGVFFTGQALETLYPCDLLPEDALSSCQLSQSFQALCLGSALGLPAGATFLGVGLAGLILDVQGGLWGALLGSMVGELLGLPQCSLFGPLLGLPLTLNAPADSDLSLLLNPIMLSALGATLGFNVGLVAPASTPAPAFPLIEVHWRF